MPLNQNKKASVKKSNTRYSTSRSTSRVGSSGLARSSKSSLFTRRNGLIVAALAAVCGVVAVAFSFAGGTPDYQYSLTTKCAGQQASQSCKDLSAEAMVYRLYKGIFNRPPAPSEYAYWTQKLAGDRQRSQDMATSLIPSNPALKAASNQQFVETIYTGVFGRAADPKGPVTYVKRLNNKSLTRGQVLVDLVISKNAKVNNESAFNLYLASAAPVTIKENAKEDQLKRLAAMKNYAKLAQASANSAKKHENAAKSALSAAKNSTSLEAISANKQTAVAEATKAGADARAAIATKAAASRLKAKATELAEYATDIGSNPTYGMAKINDVYKIVVAYDKNATKSSSEAVKTLAQIDAAYAAREAKIAEEAARRAIEQANVGADSGGDPGPNCSGSQIILNGKCVNLSDLTYLGDSKKINDCKKLYGNRAQISGSVGNIACTQKPPPKRCNSATEVRRGNACVQQVVFAKSVTCPSIGSVKLRVKTRPVGATGKNMYNCWGVLTTDGVNFDPSPAANSVVVSRKPELVTCFDSAHYQPVAADDYWVWCGRIPGK